MLPISTDSTQLRGLTVRISQLALVHVRRNSATNLSWPAPPRSTYAHSCSDMQKSWSGRVLPLILHRHISRSSSRAGAAGASHVRTQAIVAASGGIAGKGMTTAGISNPPGRRLSVIFTRSL